jgi:hypothetical protein
MSVPMDDHRRFSGTKDDDDLLIVLAETKKEPTIGSVITINVVWTVVK